jgi:XTP/dITP diphosphohydrolase
MHLLVATTNRNKLREIRGILTGLDVDLVGLETFPAVAEPAETGRTFGENARTKAVYYSTILGVVAVAEDSGFEIDALDGEPGLQSARYGGVSASYPEKFALLYGRLRERDALDSPARFVCALAVARGDRILFEAHGTIEGRVADVPRGDAGFGYDPMFYYPPLGRTLGEVPDGEKAMVSHRGRAFRQLLDYLQCGAPAGMV